MCDHCYMNPPGFVTCKSWPKMNALITTHIQMYDVMRLKRLIIKKKMFYVEINEKKKCLVRNRCEYFTMIEITFGRRHNVLVGSAS